MQPLKRDWRAMWSYGSILLIINEMALTEYFPAIKYVKYIFVPLQNVWSCILRVYKYNVTKMYFV